MTLRRHSNGLSLADSIQITAQARRTCHIRVAGLNPTAEGFVDGDFFSDRGEPVFASYGDLEGAAAVHAAVNEDNTIYCVDTITLCPARNLTSGWEEALRILRKGGPFVFQNLFKLRRISGAANELLARRSSRPSLRSRPGPVTSDHLRRQR